MGASQGRWSDGLPSYFRYCNFACIRTDNGVDAWSFSSSQYLQTAVKNVEEWLSKMGNGRWKLPSKAEMPMRSTYQPELDISKELSTEESSYYQSLIGVLRWIVELGRIDICLEVSMMSSHLALPREGHLEQVFQIFAYLKKYHSTELVYDPSDLVVNEHEFDQRDWTVSEFGHLHGVEVMALICWNHEGWGLP